MSYTILDQRTVIEYVKAHPLAASLLDVNVPLDSAEIGDGNLNLVFRVYERSCPTRSILVKQALPYLRVAGEGWPLGQQRASFEAHALNLEHEHAPGLVPRPYWYDAELSVNTMEDLVSHEVIRRPLIQRTAYAGLGRAIGEFLANTLFGTSDFSLGSKDKKHLITHFVNTELCELTEDLIFTEPFEPGPNRNRYHPNLQSSLTPLQKDAEVKANVASLKFRFMTSAQALLHGDLHTGSIMATPPGPQGESSIRIIDPEFAFFGPMGFDLGLFLANLLLNAVAQHGHAPTEAGREEYREYLYTQAREAWTTFEGGFRGHFVTVNNSSWSSRAFQDDFLLGVLRDTAGFAGCEMVRRTVGFAHVADLDSIEDETKRLEAERISLNVGQTLILSHSTLTNYEQFERLFRRSLAHLEIRA